MTTKNNEDNLRESALDWRVEHGDDPWDVTSNLTTFLPIVATAEANGVRWTVVLDQVDERLACTSIDVQRLEGGPIVTSELLRSFPMGREQYRIVNRAGLAPRAHDPLATVERPADLLAAGPTDDALRYIADVYQLAHACGLNPTREVAERGLARSTAERWVRKAREKGML